jgi:hypothetical protein
VAGVADDDGALDIRHVVAGAVLKEAAVDFDGEAGVVVEQTSGFDVKFSAGGVDVHQLWRE